LNRFPELEVIPACERFGIGLLPYMPLAGGLLTGKVRTEDNTRTRELEKEYNMKAGQSEQLKEYSKLCKELGANETAVAIAWVLSNPVVSSAIVGIRTLSHLDITEEAITLKLPDDFKESLEELFNINKGRKLNGRPAPEAYAW
jgi:aryl-alcohol dehydrogenase-like predicted oxidoreductase